MRYLTDDAVLDAVLASPWEQGAAQADLGNVPELLLAAEVSDAIDALVVDVSFDAVPGARTLRCSTDCSHWRFEDRS